MLQTIERAFAYEEHSSDSVVVEPVITDAVLERVERDAIPIALERTFATDAGGELSVPVDDTGLSDAGTLPEVAETPQGDSTSDSPPESVQPSDGAGVVTDSGQLPEDINTSPPPLTVDESIQTDLLSSSTEEVIDVLATSTPTLTVESDQMIQFNKNNCVAVEDGSFYCQKATTTEAVADEGLYALPDADGDLELYLKRADELRQLTFNTVDDASPYYDPASDTIVWHRFIDERYQIMVMDVASGEEVQLTDTSTNNMEAFRYDNIIVWQYWANNAWQIMFYDGDTITQLTDTFEHNLAPVVRNGLVVWHRITNGVKTIEVYDISTASFMTIEDEGGGTITNPRMVLVFDSTTLDGDVVTKGYDLITGEITDFVAPPVSVPDEIPTPDPMEETRALVQTKSTGRESSESSEIDGVGATSPNGLIPDVASSTPSNIAGTTLTLDLSTSTFEIVPESVAPVVLPVDVIPDLIIPSFNASSSQNGDTVVE